MAGSAKLVSPGPETQAVWSKVEKTPGSRGTIIMRFNREEYETYYAALERAKHEGEKLEDLANNFENYMTIMNDEQELLGPRGPWIKDNQSNDADGCMVGHKGIILMWLLMRAGAGVPRGTKEIVMGIIAEEVRQ
ncbi:hypothetical protein TrLO_g9461 [Triparma laevis f. longispina]|uniref:Uncharacterized protein n=1 Tax=Triparma laevis f. longispina TaxID=1714387 RepID=A0A9W7EH93_9STRA|nr:hypothetical protein TrLO_g9461 [Triparma laevis f. longispina]